MHTRAQTTHLQPNQPLLVDHHTRVTTLHLPKHLPVRQPALDNVGKNIGHDNPGRIIDDVRASRGIPIVPGTRLGGGRAHVEVEYLERALPPVQCRRGQEQDDALAVDIPTSPPSAPHPT